MLLFSFFTILIKRMQDLSLIILEIMLKKCGSSLKIKDPVKFKKFNAVLYKAFSKKIKKNQCYFDPDLIDFIEKGKNKNHKEKTFVYDLKRRKMILINWRSLLIPTDIKSSTWWKLFVAKAQQILDFDKTANYFATPNAIATLVFSSNFFEFIDPNF